jgi:MFS family permease
MMQEEISKNYRFNIVVNVTDGAFFGLALGAASSVAILPLFVSTLTDSATLIGLISAIHIVGWQLPQLFTASRVSRLQRYKPMVLAVSLWERLPFFGLAFVAWFVTVWPANLVLILTYFLLIVQGLAGGLAATAWQSLIAKIIPPRRIGLFFGVQAAAANMLMSVGSVVAGFLLERLPTPIDYTLTFIIAGAAMMVSFGFLAVTREPTGPKPEVAELQRPFWAGVRTIIRRDPNFRWFVVARFLAQFASIAFAFYIVYAVDRFQLGESTAGLMAGVFSVVQIAANPLMGWIGDRWGHRTSMEIGLISAIASAFLAWFAPSPGWFYLVFGLAGMANVALWTIVIAMTLRFGSPRDRPTYIGLANSLVAPATFLAPVIGGWLADRYGFEVTFLVTGFGGLLALGAFHWFVREPAHATAN